MQEVEVADNSVARVEYLRVSFVQRLSVEDKRDCRVGESPLVSIF